MVRTLRSFPKFVGCVGSHRSYPTMGSGTMRFDWQGGLSKLTSPSDTATSATGICFTTSLRIQGGMQLWEGRLKQEEEEVVVVAE
jgi:hypothetical protein